MFLPSAVHPCSAETAIYGEVGALILIGVGISIYAAALWPCIPYVVEAKTVGTAFGICTALQNAGLAIVPTICGLINDNTQSKDYGYFYESLFWACLTSISLTLSIILYIWDIRTGGILNRVDKG